MTLVGLPVGAVTRLRTASRAEAALALLLAVGACTALGVRPLLVGVLWLAAVTPRLVAVDIAEHRLPDAIVLRGYPVALAAVGFEAVSGHDPGGALAAALVAGALFLALHLLGGMGLGDVKLAPVLALLLGSAGAAAAVVGAAAALLAGGVAAVAALVARGRGSRIPFGPPLLLGTWAGLLLLS